MKLKVVEPGDGRLIVKVWPPLVPPAVVTVTVRGPPAEASATTKAAVSDVLLLTTTLVTVTSLPLTVTVVAPTTKLVPVSVTATVVPRMPSFGETLVSVGGGGLTVKLCAPLVPPAVVTVTEWGPIDAGGSSTSSPSATYRCPRRRW